MDKILNRKRLVILGLNSGTSADGLDLAALRFSRSSKGVRIKFLQGLTRRFDKTLRDEILRCSDSRRVSLEELISLDQMLGVFFGRKAVAFVNSLATSGVAVDAVASHGQTVRHMPSARRIGPYHVRGTLQLGSPEQIAKITGKVVVSDFRQADIALGGEGAPITVEAMRRLLADSNESRLIVNIGGMANFFYFPRGAGSSGTRAADCGPGNVLCDLLSKRLFGEKYDRDGRRAAQGEVSGILMSLLKRHSARHRKTISTGREVFGVRLIERMLASAKRHSVSYQDVMATAAEFTVRSILERVVPIIARDSRVEKLYLTGGGVHNKFFVRRLKTHLGDVEVDTVDKLGMSPDLAEAAAYAVIGHNTLVSRPTATRFGSPTRQTGVPILGRIIQPPARVSW
ncbi:MAG: anhydro-N-acetylmuramic acid kinase [Candidatus Zixiibacteriota bacterium]|nr:MAG: anhydro-N-acetylmuramic acid kinase [candidate division Zixibacteria bacterium]